MNRYYLTYPFKDKYYYAEATANEMANEMLPDSDDYFEFTMNNEGQYMEWHITDEEGNKYSVTFSNHNKNMLTIYDDSKEIDAVVAEVPWLCYKIEDIENETTLYNIGG